MYILNGVNPRCAILENLPYFSHGFIKTCAMMILLEVSMIVKLVLSHQDEARRNLC